MGKDFSFLQFVIDQFRDLPGATVDLTGRTVLVTGANSGLGWEAALKFLRMRPEKLILAVRGIEKGEAAARRLLETANETRTGVVEVWECDLARFESVIRFADRVERELERVDIALLNAGVNTWKWSTTADGYETS
jgi:retinol dehydrogenase 12